MIELAVAHSNGLSRAAIDRLRAALPSERRHKSSSYPHQSDRDASVVTFALLQRLWRERDGGPLPDVVAGNGGKPTFAGNEDRYFNLSHDPPICVCVLAPAPVGVDVQTRVPFDDALFDRIASPNERELREQFRRSDDLSALWTGKEAIMKRSGQGLSCSPRHIDTVAATDIVTLREGAATISVSVQGMSADEVLAELRIRHPQLIP